jgi:L-ribulose-5-phosphate 3-epimerase
MKIAVRLESLGLPLRAALEQAARMGAAGAQVDAAGDLSPERLSGTGRREFVNLLSSLNLQLSALNCPLRRGLDMAEDQQPRLERVRKTMTLSYDLGARVAIVELPRIPDDLNEEPSPQPTRAGGLILASAPLAANPATVLRESLADLGKFGDRIGASLALEFGLDAADRVAAYLARFDTGALGVDYDPANMFLSGFDPIQSLTPLRGRILHVQARDARRSGVTRTGAEVALGAGDIDWMTLIAVLDSLEYRGWVSVKRDLGDERLADVTNGVAFLRRFILSGEATRSL